MTAAQELFEHLRDAKPSGRRRDEKQGSDPLKTSAPAGAANSGILFKPLTPSRVELPALGGCVEILYDWSDEP